MRKELGKIERVSIGLGGYQGVMLGIHFILSGKGWGANDTKSAWDYNLIKCTERCEWTEDQRALQYVDIMRYISDLLESAKVTSVDKLVGKPIEAEFDGMVLKSWRILEEVL